MYVVIANTDEEYCLVDTQLGELKYIDETTLISLLKCAVKVENFDRKGYTQGNVNDLPDIDDVETGDELFFVLRKNEKFGKDSYTVVSTHVFTERELSLKQINKLFLANVLVNAKVELQDGEQVVCLKKGELPVNISGETINVTRRESQITRKTKHWFSDEEEEVSENNIVYEEVYTSGQEVAEESGKSDEKEDLAISMKSADELEEEINNQVYNNVGASEEADVEATEISEDGVHQEDVSGNIEDDFDYSGLEDMEIDLYGDDSASPESSDGLDGVEEEESVEEAIIEVAEGESIEEPVIEVAEGESIEEPVIEVAEGESIEEPIIEVAEGESIEEPDIEVAEGESIEEPIIEVAEGESVKETSGELDDIVANEVDFEDTGVQEEASSLNETETPVQAESLEMNNKEIVASDVDEPNIKFSLDKLVVETQDENRYENTKEPVIEISEASKEADSVQTENASDIMKIEIIKETVTEESVTEEIKKEQDTIKTKDEAIEDTNNIIVIKKKELDPILKEKYLKELTKRETKKEKVAINEELRGKARKYLVANRKKSVDELLEQIEVTGLSEKEIKMILSSMNGSLSKKIKQSVLFATLCATLNTNLDVCGMDNDN